jgi:predicted aldo/keto reductase-like oxidoreductase
MFLCEGYYLRYNLKEWALSRYNSMKVLPSQCVKCGKCEQRCPYKLQIREKIEKIVNLMEGKNE